MANDAFDAVIIGGGIVGSWLASELAEQGRRVALVERGDNAPPTVVKPLPAVTFTHRRHAGAIEARNQVLGGNGWVWGGGIMRPPDTHTQSILGQNGRTVEDDSDLGDVFDYIERLLGIRFRLDRSEMTVRDARIGPCEVAEICVLPGRSRNVSAFALRRMEGSAVTRIFPRTQVAAFDVVTQPTGSRNIRAVHVVQDGMRHELHASTFVVAAGPLDTNVFVQRHAPSLGVNADEAGHHLHDHFSLPIANLTLSRDEGLRAFLAPQFRDGLVVGRHFELSPSSGWGARGFLHFQFHFDEVSPYREIKTLMALRQQSAPVGALFAGALPIVASLPSVLRIGVERALRQRLYLSDALRVTATLDFESFPHRANSVVANGDNAEFAWQIHAEDEVAFLELLARARFLVDEIAETHGVRNAPLVDPGNPAAAIEYFHATATDAFHLGGGLAAGSESGHLVTPSLRLGTTDNVYVMSAATFRRPGVVNPTHALLALAQRFARDH